MLGKYAEQQRNEVAGYDIDGTPRQVSELKKILDAEVDKIKSGDFVSIQDFSKSSEGID